MIFDDVLLENKTSVMIFILEEDIVMLIVFIFRKTIFVYLDKL